MLYESESVLVTQSCPILWEPMDGSAPGSSVHGDSPGKNIGMSSYFLLQGIFLTQGSNPDLLHSRQIPCHLSHQGNPMLYEIHLGKKNCKIQKIVSKMHISNSYKFIIKAPKTGKSRF